MAVLGAAGAASAGPQTTLDLSPYVNQGFTTNGWFIDGGQFYVDLVGTTHGNLGSQVAFQVADVGDLHLNFWYGLDNGSHTNLFDGVADSFTVPVGVSGASQVYILADNTFGRDGANEFDVTFHGANSDLNVHYIGGQNTKDYNTANCASTGCLSTPGATDWYDDPYSPAILQVTTWTLPSSFNLKSITFNQIDNPDGAIVAGVTVAVPEPATWATMILGFGLAGAAFRRRRVLAAA